MTVSCRLFSIVHTNYNFESSILPVLILVLTCHMCLIRQKQAVCYDSFESVNCSSGQVMTQD